MIKAALATAATAVTGLLLAQPAFAQSEQKLGKVNFETSCKPEAQKHFNRAMLYQHSFWYRLLGHCAESSLESTRAAVGEKPCRGRGHDRQGQERRRQDPARA